MKHHQSTPAISKRKRMTKCFDSNDPIATSQSTIRHDAKLSLFKYSPLALVICSILASGPVLANPQGGEVVAGQASINQTAPGRLDVIQNTDKAIIDWKGFSIDKSEQTHFQQPNASSMALNRVYGGQTSVIDGKLTANGRVLLVNPNGVLFGKDASVNVGSLIATTSDIDNKKFMADGQLVFDKQSTDPNAAVVNSGQIQVAEGGAVVLAAPSVSNEGLIKARLGQVVLAGTDHYTLDFNGDGLLRFDLGDQGQSDKTSSNKVAVSNSGTIVADGGVVQMTARVADSMVDRVINMDGVVQAQSVQEQNGTIVLSGGDSGIVAVSGTLDASGRNSGESGGDVKVLGEKVGLFDGSNIDVSGDQGGGTVLVGGNYQGKGPEPNAQRTVVSHNAQITADALTEGDGGKVVVWADEATSFKGDIQAKGGAEGGNGGFVEVSGKQALNFQGDVDLAAKQGAVGTLLLDPENISIQAAVLVGLSGFPDDIELSDNQILAGDSPGSDFLISEEAVESLSANADVIFEANNNITISNLLDGVLTFQASTGSVTFTADADNNGSGSFILDDITLVTQGGNLSITAADMVEQGVSSEIVTNGGDISLSSNQFNLDFLLLDSSSANIGGNINVQTIGDLVLTGRALNIDSRGQNQGGNINLLSTGIIDIGHVDSSSTSGIGGSINIIANGSAVGVGDIFTGILNASGNTGGGQVNLTSDGNILTDFATEGFPYNPINTSSVNGIAGNVDLIALGTIEVGNINTTGVNASSSGDINLIASDGINIDSASFTAGGGNITLTATKSGGGSAILLAGGSSLETIGNGTISLTGTITNPSDATTSTGVSINGQSPVVRTENGTITIIGSATGIDSQRSTGVAIGPGGNLEATGTGNVEATGAGNIEITGFASGGWDSQGIVIGGVDPGPSFVRSNGGTINLTGTVVSLGDVQSIIDFINSGGLTGGPPGPYIFNTDNFSNGIALHDNAFVQTSGASQINLTGIDGNFGSGILLDSVFDPSGLPVEILAQNNSINLTADKIYLGNASISGIDRLTIDPLTPSLNFVLGGNATSNYLNTDELVTLQDGFSEIIIGHENGSGTITVDPSGILLNDNGTLRSPNTGGSIVVNGPIQTNGNNLTLNAGDVVDINANITTLGGQIDIISGGIIDATGNSAVLDSSFSAQGGNINLTAGTDILAGDIISTGLLGGGSVSITSNNGIIDLGNIRAFTDQGTGGNVFLNAQNDIFSTDISSSSVNGTAGNVNIVSSNGMIELGEVNATSALSNGGTIVLNALEDITSSNLYASAINNTGNTGSSGGITLFSSNGDIVTDGLYSPSSAVSGSAGNSQGISVQASNGGIAISGPVWTFSEADNQAGNGGSISLVAENNITVSHSTATLFGVVQSASRSTSGTAGNGGSINIQSNSGSILINDIITSLTNGSTSAGQAGTINVSSFNELNLNGINASSSIVANGGDVTISSANGSLIINNDIIANGGSVTLTANKTVPATTSNLTLLANIEAEILILTAADGVNQSSGVIQTSELGVDAASAIFLAGNAVDTLAVLLTGANNAFAWTDLNDLTIGSVEALSGITLNNGNLALTTAGTLAINQALADIDALSLNATDLALAANITANTTRLNAGNAITQTGGTIQSGGLGIDAVAANFSGTNAVDTLAVRLTGANNAFAWTDLNDLTVGSVGTLSGITLNNGNLALTAAGTLTINQALTGIDALSLNATDLTLAANITANTALLNASNAINQTAGTIQSGGLGIDAVAANFSGTNAVDTLAVLLTGANNAFAWTNLNDLTVGSVDTLSGITLNNGNLALTTAGTLTINQVLTGIDALSLNATDLTLAANITANTTRLNAGNAINQTAGTIQSGGLGVEAANATFLNGNAVDTLAVHLSGAGTPFSYSDPDNLTIGTVGTLAGISLTNGNLDLTATGTLAINQALTGIDALSLNATELTLAANITATTTRLNASNAINQTGGTIQSSGLGVEAANATFLNGNAVDTLAVHLSGAGTPFSYSDPDNLTIGTVGTLAGISLTNGNLDLTATGTLTISQALTGIDALSLNATDLTLAANITANTALLNAGNAITQTGGTIQSGGLAVEAANATFLNGNAVDTLAVHLSGAGTPFSYSSPDNLTVGSVGSLIGITLNNGNLSLTAAGTLTVNQALAGIDTLSLNANDLTLAANIASNSTQLTASNQITQTAGTLQSGTLGVDAVAANFSGTNAVDTLAVLLTGANNAFAWTDLNDLTIGSVGALSGISLTNGNLDLTATGTLAINQALAGIDALSLTATDLVLAANITANTALLNAGNAINQSAGIIQSGGLGVEAANAAFLAGNAVDTLAVLSTGANNAFAWTDLNDLTIGSVGALSGISLTNGNLDLTATGTLAINQALAGIDALSLNATDLVLAANVTANTALLNAGNAINQTDGTIQSDGLGVEAANATFLAGNAVDTLAVRLTGANNAFTWSDLNDLTVGSVGTLSGITLNNGNLALTTAGTLAINQALAGIDALSLNATDLTLAANITANTALLNAGNAINQTGGTIQSGGLGVEAANATFLNGNAIDTLAVHLTGTGTPFSYSDPDNLTIGTVGTLAGISLTNGNLALTATGTLAINQALADIDALSLNATDLTLAGNITANSAQLHAANAINQTGGIIQSGRLGIDAVAANFSGTNAVDTLAVNLTGAGNAFAFTDQDDLTVGLVDSLTGITLNNGDLSLTANDDLLVSQAISGVHALTLTATTISTTGINTGNSQTYNGNLQLAGNFETSTGGFSVTGNSTLTDDTNLLISGDVIFNNIVGNYDLSIISTNDGNVTFNTDIGVINRLFVSADTINLHDVTTNGPQTYNGQVISHSDYFTNGGAFTINGTSHFLSNTLIDTSGGSIQFNGTVNGANSMTLSAGNTGDILFGGDVNILNGLNINSANDVMVLGRLEAASVIAVYQGDFSTGPAGFLEVGYLEISPTAQSANLYGIVGGASGKDAALQIEGPVGNDLFTINGCTIGIPCEIPPAAQPRHSQFAQMISTTSLPAQIPTIVKMLARHRPPSVDPTNYQFSNLGNEELWDNNPGAYSVSSFAVFTVSSDKQENNKNTDNQNED